VVQGGGNGLTMPAGDHGLGVGVAVVGALCAFDFIRVIAPPNFFTGTFWVGYQVVLLAAWVTDLPGVDAALAWPGFADFGWSICGCLGFWLCFLCGLRRFQYRLGSGPGDDGAAYLVVVVLH